MVRTCLLLKFLVSNLAIDLGYDEDYVAKKEDNAGNDKVNTQTL